MEDLIAHRYLKDNFSDAELRMARYIFETDLWLSNMMTRKKEYRRKSTNIQKPSNIIEFSYLKFCAKKFDDSDNMLERIFLFLHGYALREYKNTWRLNLNNLENDLRCKVFIL